MRLKLLKKACLRSNLENGIFWVYVLRDSFIMPNFYGDKYFPNLIRQKIGSIFRDLLIGRTDFYRCPTSGSGGNRNLFLLKINMDRRRLKRAIYLIVSRCEFIPNGQNSNHSIYLEGRIGCMQSGWNDFHVNYIPLVILKPPIFDERLQPQTLLPYFPKKHVFQFNILDLLAVKFLIFWSVLRVTEANSVRYYQPIRVDH